MREADLGSTANPDETVGKRRVPFRGARLALAAMAATGAVACTEKVEYRPCPTSEVGVSYQVGGYPANWKAMDEFLGAWSFESEGYQKLDQLNDGRGRVEILDGLDSRGGPKRGKMSFFETVETRRAFYVCVDEEGTQDQSSRQSPSFDVPFPLDQNFSIPSPTPKSR